MFAMGRGGAGFSLAGPAVTPAQGGIFCRWSPRRALLPPPKFDGGRAGIIVKKLPLGFQVPEGRIPNTKSMT